MRLHKHSGDGPAPVDRWDELSADVTEEEEEEEEPVITVVTIVGIVILQEITLSRLAIKMSNEGKHEECGRDLLGGRETGLKYFFLEKLWCSL